MTNQKIMVCLIDDIGEFEEYKILLRQDALSLLNQKIKKDPMVLAFMDSMEVEGKNIFPVYKINRKTNKIYLWVAPSIAGSYPYEWETIQAYIKNRYGNFTEL